MRLARADAHRKNETYAETLLAAKAYGQSQGIPYKWMLIDSWWYFEGAVPGPQDSGECFGGFGGVTWQWDSKPIPPARNCSGNFPGGWPQFAKDLGLPFMMHISEVRMPTKVRNNARSFALVCLSLVRVVSVGRGEDHRQGQGAQPIRTPAV